MAKFHLAAAFGAALAATVSMPAFAAPELITNGNFTYSTSSTTIATTSQQVTNTNLYGWSLSTTPGYSFVYVAGAGTSGSTADTTGASGQYGTVALWGPGNARDANGNVINNGFTNSPAGTTFVAMDNNFQNAALQQTVTGLSVGSTYTLSFYWAAAQQYGFDGTTQEQFTVKFGNQSALTNTITLASHGFAAWTKVTMYFTATSTSQVLSFLATGTPGGNPPFSLLDGVSLQAAPEPATLAVLGTGIAGLMGLRAARRRKKA